MTPGMLTRYALIALLLCTGVARADYLEAARREALEQAVEDLLAHAKWCTKNKLYRSRDITYRLIIQLDPDQKKARRKLRYVRHSGGTWKRTRPLPDTYDRKLDLHPERDERRRGIGKRYADTVMPILEGGGTTGSLKTRASVLTELFLIDPENARARTFNGEVRAGSRWLLTETVRARARRRFIRDAARKALAQAPVGKPVTPTVEEMRYGIRWTASIDAGGWRVLISAPAHEAPACQRAGDASGPFFESLFRLGPLQIPGARMMLLGSNNEYARLLKKHPGLTARDRARYARLGGCWLPGGMTFVSRGIGGAETRLDEAARMPLSVLLWKKLGMSAKQGWVWEGFGLYMSYHLVGYRRTTFVRYTRYSNDQQLDKKMNLLWGEMLSTHASWFAIAKREAKSKFKPDWALLLSKDVNQMNTRDLLESYMLAAFILEAHPKKAAGILKRIGAGESSVIVLQETLGMPLPALEARVGRWVREHAVR